MSIYVSDAVAFLHYLLDRLPPKANGIFKLAEHGQATIYLPTIAAAELYHLFRKKGWLERWLELKRLMRKTRDIRYYPLNEEVINILEETKAEEIHDRIIVLTAKLAGADGLITKDESLKNLDEVTVIW